MSCPESECRHQWQEEYYGFRCLHCRLFMPHDAWNSIEDGQPEDDWADNLEDYS